MTLTNRTILTILTAALMGAPRAQVLGRESIVAYLKLRAHPLTTASDLDPLIERIGDARVVLLGEASHGTAEYYTWRAAITKRLIAEKGFNFVAVEGDWPSCYQVNRFVKQLPDAPETVEAALAAFQRWPKWMWANRETADLAAWMATHNAGRPADRKAGFFGIDLYAPGDSISAVLAYTQAETPWLNEQVQAAYGHFAAFGSDFHQYARYTATGSDFSQQTRLVVELLRAHAATLREANPEAFFNAKQNAYAVKRAEMHFRAMADPAANSWNKRAEHMTHTFTRLLDAHGPASKGIVWAHNTHIGDARATDMAAAGMKNIGWLARETYGEDAVVAVGFATHRGRLLAGRQWGGAMETMTMPPALAGSIGDLFNQLGMERLLVVFDDDTPPALRQLIGHRAKGVTYHPERDRGNYVPSILPKRYDAMIFIAETTPLAPLGEGR